MPGALLGGLVLGLFTALFGTYLPFLTDGIIGSEYTDVFVFSLLVLLLVTRPQGLLGRKGGDKV